MNWRPIKSVAFFFIRLQRNLHPSELKVSLKIRYATDKVSIIQLQLHTRVYAREKSWQKPSLLSCIAFIVFVGSGGDCECDSGGSSMCMFCKYGTLSVARWTSKSEINSLHAKLKLNFMNRKSDVTWLTGVCALPNRVSVQVLGTDGYRYRLYWLTQQVFYDKVSQNTFLHTKRVSVVDGIPGVFGHLAFKIYFVELGQ